MIYDICLGTLAAIAVLLLPVNIVTQFKKTTARKAWWQAGAPVPSGLLDRYRRLSNLEAATILILVFAFAINYLVAAIVCSPLGQSADDPGWVVRTSPVLAFACLYICYLWFLFSERR